MGENFIEGESYWMILKHGEPHASALWRYGEYRSALAHTVECPFSDSTPIWDITNVEDGYLMDQLTSYYDSLILDKKYWPGPYGDWLKVSFFTIDKKNYAILNLIGKRAWNKPTLAADLGIFIKSGEKHFFVGIVRGSEPAKGKTALIGGIVDTGEILESDIYTAIREAQEEAGLDLRYDGDWEELKEDYTTTTIDVKVKNFRKLSPVYLLTPAKIHYVSTIKTPELERLPSGLKRVYRVSAYYLYVEFDKFSLTPDHIKTMFEAGDDARSLYIQDVSKCFDGSDFKSAPDFGFPHHLELFKDMVLNIKEKR